MPYRYGCFSFQSYADRRNLTDAGHLIAGEDWQLKQSGFLKDLSESDAKKILAFKKHYESIRGDAQVREVYRHYPYYATRSQIAGRLMSASELENIEKARPTGESPRFYTIGYKGASFENYLNRLVQNNIKEHKRVAITCFEAEQCMCHRGRVAKALQQFPNWQYGISHI